MGMRIDWGRNGLGVVVFIVLHESLVAVQSRFMRVRARASTSDPHHSQKEC